MEPTREIFGNISPTMQALFFLLVLLSLGAMGWHIWRRARLWWRGVCGGHETDWRVWIQRLAEYGLTQKRVRKFSLGGLLHLCLFAGFLILFLGTTLLFIADFGPSNFHHGKYYLFYEASLDLFGLMFCIGCGLAICRRLVAKPASLGHNALDWLLLSLLLAIGLTGFLVEGFRLLYTDVHPEVARWSIVGWSISLLLSDAIGLAQARTSHLVLWWVHVILICSFFALIPFSRFLHVLTGPLNLALRPSKSMGALTKVQMSRVEETGEMGVGKVSQFTRQQLLSLDACMECGRCQDVCPAYEAQQPLSPEKLIGDLKDWMGRQEVPKEGELVPSESVWACTMCQACVSECPVLIGHVDLIADLRRYQVAEGKLAGMAGQTLRRLGTSFDPYGRFQSARLDWIEDLNIPTVESNPGFEYLLWVGCAGAYDPRIQKVVRALVRLFQIAQINFAVLGTKEKCTGDPARRLGEEFLFQQLAQDNIKTLERHKVRKIVTPCPHCFNTFKNEYSDFGGDFEVQHHSQFLSHLVQSKALVPRGSDGQSITFHDPCYLARVNEEVRAPRTLVAASRHTFREMPRRGKNTSCCGAGGGRFWSDDTSPEQRISRVRAKEAMETGANILATGCPFCLNMMNDGLRSLPEGDNIRTMDIAEVLLESIQSDSESPATVHG